MIMLLFDMDGVLLTPAGYHRALMDTVALLAEALGFPGLRLTQEDIDFFESVGVTSEWDAAAITLALLLDRLWQAHPDFRLPTAPPLPPAPEHGLEPPDLRAFFNRLRPPDGRYRRPTEIAERLLVDEGTRPAAHAEALRKVLRRARDVRASLTHRLFQEMALGSQVFQETYGLEPHLNCESYLLRHDRSNLPATHRQALLNWLRAPAHRAAIFTNRPSKPPPGHFDTPEAELGAELVGLERLPLVGGGGLGWLAARRGLPEEAFLKPSPVHTLAALRAALGDAQETALEAAAALALDRLDDGGWRSLEGAQVVVFEDAAKGVVSARAAVAHLAGAGVHLELRPLGVTKSPEKGAALRTLGTPVYGTLPEALATVPGLEAVGA